MPVLQYSRRSLLFPPQDQKMLMIISLILYYLCFQPTKNISLFHYIQRSHCGTYIIWVFKNISKIYNQILLHRCTRQVGYDEFDFVLLKNHFPHILLYHEFLAIPYWQGNQIDSFETGVGHAGPNWKTVSQLTSDYAGEYSKFGNVWHSSTVKKGFCCTHRELLNVRFEFAFTRTSSPRSPPGI